MGDNDGESALRRLTGSAMAMAGAGAGAAAGLLFGNPVAGAVVGQALAEVGNDIARRVLSPRQEERAGTVLVLAAAAVVAKETMGETVREDGFFDGERSDRRR